MDQLHAVIDRLVPPKSIRGWAIGGTEDAKGRDLLVTIWHDGCIIGQGPLSHDRPDLRPRGFLGGFEIECGRPVPDEDIAFGRLVVEVSDRSGRKTRALFDDKGRAESISRLLRSAAPFGRLALGALLSGVLRSEHVDDRQRRSLLQVHAESFAPPRRERPALTAEAEARRRLMFRFESLGSNCHLGAVQRAFGAEPIGLFRFAGIHVHAVTQALATRFAGVGSPEFTRLDPGLHGEYYSRDTRYHMQSHTFKFVGRADYDKLYKQLCQKLARLADALVESIMDGSRILVVHGLPGEIPAEDLQRLLRAIRSIGPSSLLYVRSANDAFAAGAVTEREDGLMVGYVEAPTHENPMQHEEQERAGWLTMLQNAADMVDAGNLLYATP